MEKAEDLLLCDVLFSLLSLSICLLQNKLTYKLNHILLYISVTKDESSLKEQLFYIQKFKYSISDDLQVNTSLITNQ